MRFGIHGGEQNEAGRLVLRMRVRVREQNDCYRVRVVIGLRLLMLVIQFSRIRHVGRRGRGFRRRAAYVFVLPVVLLKSFAFSSAA